MCFDKTRTRHNQWSTLPTYIHLHVNQPEFVQRLLPNSDLGSTLPVVVMVTLDKYISDATYSGDGSMSLRTQTHDREVRIDTRSDPCLTREEDEKKRMILGKRRTPCSTGYYEAHEGRLEDKVMRP